MFVIFFHLYKDEDSHLYKQDSLSKKCDISISVFCFKIEDPDYQNITCV